ncbi:probable G-protein coupled receptor 160 isoform X2 [Macaca thibetana thibetana]|uniref:probable G-protein coupled receptor 160 isoform X2 n=1 Tax=Macaca thibetana thibetana TaxID=257877 RepID=UPI0021BC94D2|nr:probable G-protein coupled receptor 160 isoform X2 [Macaca thibetana thibetana]XP_050634233.1 probable G-protein coupled receptor 160 isoform X2 [Macaca thibetana thibetana]
MGVSHTQRLATLSPGEMLFEHDKPSKVTEVGVCNSSLFPGAQRCPRGGGRAAPCSPEANALTRPPEAGSAGRNRSGFVLHLRKCLRAYSHSILVYQNEMQGTKNNITEGSKSKIK